MEKLYFASDYQEGCHPALLDRLVETNLIPTPGYGTDAYCAAAREKLRLACGCPKADVHFLVGGTQTNAVTIDALLRPWEGVLAAETGHISVHEAGAIEWGGHKVLTLPHTLGKLTAQAVESYCGTFFADANRDHMVAPGLVYLSQPTEFGTLYSLAELTALRQVCLKWGLRLYVDGARLAYALGCPENDVDLPDLAGLCDAFYVGGTKCGALFGEALVVPDPALLPHFFPIVKQHGALLAKGRLLGLQFDALFTDNLYREIGKQGVRLARRLSEGLLELGFPSAFPSPTNQLFFSLDEKQLAALGSLAQYSFWEKPDKDHTVIRLACSWATREEDVNLLLKGLKGITHGKTL